MATTRLWTIDEVATLPDDGFRYALVKAKMHRMPPPMGPWGRIAATVARHIGNFVAERGLGAVYDQSGFVMARNPDTLLGPDLAFVQTAHVPRDEDSYPEVAPALVIEIASLSQSGPSIEETTRLFLAAEVRLVWIVDPVRQTVGIHRADGRQQLLTEADILDGENVLPDFRLPVAQLFA